MIPHIDAASIAFIGNVAAPVTPIVLTYGTSLKLHRSLRQARAELNSPAQTLGVGVATAPRSAKPARFLPGAIRCPIARPFPARPATWREGTDSGLC
jgi:hypothetical protein